MNMLNRSESKKNMTRPLKAMVLVLLSLAFVMMMLPLWQLGARSSYYAASASLAEMDAETLALRASLSGDEQIAVKSPVSRFQEMR